MKSSIKQKKRAIYKRNLILTNDLPDFITKQKQIQQ